MHFKKAKKYNEFYKTQHFSDSSSYEGFILKKYNNRMHTLPIHMTNNILKNITNIENTNHEISEESNMWRKSHSEK